MIKDVARFSGSLQTRLHLSSPVAGALRASKKRHFRASITERNPANSLFGRVDFIRVRWRVLKITVPLLFLECSSAHGQVFKDVTVSAGVDYIQWVEPDDAALVQFYMSGGAAAGDYDRDGWVDLAVTRLDASVILFRNSGDGSFEDVTTSAGLQDNVGTNGVAWSDIDNDGDLDLYLSVIGGTRFYLYINDGAGGFTEEGEIRGADLQSAFDHYGYSVTFGDYDLDGWLDIHTTEWGVPWADSENSVHSALLRNEGSGAPGHFQNVTVEAGVEIGKGITQFAFTSSLTDLDADGWPDLAMAADYGTSQLFWNNGDGTFSNGTVAAGVGTDKNGMGSAIGDYDGDGVLDWFVTSILETKPGSERDGNRLYRNLGDRRFADVTDEAGVRDGAWGWGASFFDYDNDGDLDLVMTNGMSFPLGSELELITPMRFWRNDGGVFSEVGAETGLTDEGLGKGLLTFDYDRDGDLDLFVINNAGHPVLYRNDGGNENSWLRVKTVGELSNRDGIGAVVTVEALAGGAKQVREITPGNHFLSQSELTAHFGLGRQSDPVSRVVVQWPSGIDQIFEDVPVNSELVAVESGLSEMLVSGSARLVDERTEFQSNVYNGFELMNEEATFASRAGEITRISFLDPDGDLVFAEFGSEGPRTTLTVRLNDYEEGVHSPYDQPATYYVRGLATFTIENPTAQTFFSVFSLGNDPARVDNALISAGTFSGAVNGVADIKLIRVVGEEGGTLEIGGINAANANFVDTSGLVGIAAENIAVIHFLYIGDMTPSGSAFPWLRISPSSTLSEIQVNGGDLREATGACQIDTNGAIYRFPIQAMDGQRSISNTLYRTDLGDGFMPWVRDTFEANRDRYFITD